MKIYEETQKEDGWHLVVDFGNGPRHVHTDEKGYKLIKFKEKLDPELLNELDNLVKMYYDS